MRTTDTISHPALMPLSRRRFLRNTTGVATAAPVVAAGLLKAAEKPEHLRLGLIGCGGRGQWIGRLFLNHGGYEIAAVADYFEDRVRAAGERLKVPESRRFTGLYAYRRLLEQPVDAVAIISPPYFHPEQAEAAVEAGKHVYLAKPIAVDVPGCLSIQRSGNRARERKLVFLVDFQTRANPHYQEVVRRVRAGQIGRLVSGEATYHCGPTFERLRDFLKGREHDPEARLRAWGIDRILSGDVITEQNIHALDVACWFIGREPLSAVGTGGLARGFGTCWDHFAVIFKFPDDILVSFNSKQYGHGYDDILCRMYGLTGTVDTHYSGAVRLSAKEEGYSGDTRGLYQSGAEANIATFHRHVLAGDCVNETVAESVRSNLTTILGRTAAYAGEEVTWREMMARAEKWEFDLSGLRA